MSLFGAISLFATGLLAGEEVAIRFGVRGPVASLDPQAGILLRQALIRHLRIVVPILFAVALLSSIIGIVQTGFVVGISAQAASLVCLIAFIAVTLGGTVPINQAALTWDAVAPPDGWQDMIRRWEQLDSLRTAAALAAFALLVLAGKS